MLFKEKRSQTTHDGHRTKTDHCSSPLTFGSGKLSIQLYIQQIAKKVMYMDDIVLIFFIFWLFQGGTSFVDQKAAILISLKTYILCKLFTNQ